VNALRPRVVPHLKCGQESKVRTMMETAVKPVQNGRGRERPCSSKPIERFFLSHHPHSPESSKVSLFSGREIERFLNTVRRRTRQVGKG